VWAHLLSWQTGVAHRDSERRRSCDVFFVPCGHVIHEQPQRHDHARLDALLVAHVVGHTPKQRLAVHPTHDGSALVDSVPAHCVPPHRLEDLGRAGEEEAAWQEELLVVEANCTRHAASRHDVRLVKHAHAKRTRVHPPPHARKTLEDALGPRDLVERRVRGEHDRAGALVAADPRQEARDRARISGTLHAVVSALGRNHEQARAPVGDGA
jgi:hypothetical protein